MSPGGLQLLTLLLQDTVAAGSLGGEKKKKDLQDFCFFLLASNPARSVAETGESSEHFQKNAALRLFWARFFSLQWDFFPPDETRKQIVAGSRSKTRLRV